MPINHDVVAAIPLGAGQAAVKAALRDLLVKRMVYALAAADNPQDLVAVDPASGATILGIAYSGKLFWLDPADVTTPHDGVAVLVSSEGKRYKVETLVSPYAVLDKDLTAPPGTPIVGDAYLLYGAPTGAWAGHQGEIAVYTARGWEFVAPATGLQVYVEDEDAYWHLDAGAVWRSGVGTLIYQAASVPLSALINSGWRTLVENMTTNAPPASPAVGDAYVIGSSPTGAWAGQAAKLAICQVAGTFALYAPVKGQKVYDRATELDYVWDGSAWISASGRWRVQTQVFTAGGTWSLPARCFYVFVETVGGGGGSRGTTGPGGTGGTSSFGAHCSAVGGNGGDSSTGGPGGTATGGDANFSGMPGQFDNAGNLKLAGGHSGWGRGGYGNGGSTNATTAAAGSGGGGGYACKWIARASLGASEGVTVGAAGAAGSGGGLAGQPGLVVVHEFIED